MTPLTRDRHGHPNGRAGAGTPVTELQRHARVARSLHRCGFHSLRARTGVAWSFLALAALALRPSDVVLAQSRPDGMASPRATAQVALATPALRPGDIVRLRIWREPELSGDFQVNEAGLVVFPHVGPLNVTAQLPDSIRARLVERYSAILNHNSIEVIYLRRVQILGAVRNPGLYPLDPTMTIGDAIAVAGGTTPDGDTDRMELRREGAKVALTLKRQTRVAESSIRSGDQLFVPERRWTARNTGLLATALAAVASFGIAIIVNR